MNIIILDQIGSEISLFISENGDHLLSQKIQTYLTSQDMITRGFFTGAGRLSAAGQAAFYGGSIAFVTTIAVTTLNNHHDWRKTKLKYKEAEKGRQHDRDRWAHEEKMKNPNKG